MSIEGVKNHLRTAHSEKEKIPRIFLCQVCGKSFKTASGVTAHTNYVHMHENVEQVRCEICKRYYKTKQGLKNHIILSHQSTPQNCSICGKTAPNPTALTR